jgi:hypothetical protein
MTPTTTTRRTFLTRLTRTALAAILLATAMPATPARATTTGVAYGTWKLSVKADAAAKAAGRDDFTEYVLIEYDGVTAHEMSRMGFGTIDPTLTAGPNGSVNFTVNLSSRYNGSCTWAGNLTTTTMTGTLQWTRDGRTYNYTFTGVPFTPVEAES